MEILKEAAECEEILLDTLTAEWKKISLESNTLSIENYQTSVNQMEIDLEKHIAVSSQKRAKIQLEMQENENEYNDSDCKTHIDYIVGSNIFVPIVLD